MLNDTSLVRMVIDILARRNNWSYKNTLSKFYNSTVCKGLSDRNTGMFTFSPNEIVSLLNEEFEYNKPFNNSKSKTLTIPKVKP